MSWYNLFGALLSTLFVCCRGDLKPLPSYTEEENSLNRCFVEIVNHFTLSQLRIASYSPKNTDLTFESSVTHIHKQNRWTVMTDTIDNLRSNSHTSSEPTGFIITVKALNQLKRILKNLKISNGINKYLMIFQMPLRNPPKIVSKIMRPLLNTTLNFEIIAPDPTKAAYYVVYSWMHICGKPKRNRMFYCSYGKFYNNSYAGTKKASSKRCSITAVYCERKPFMYPEMGKSQMEGIEATLLSTIASKLNLNVTYIETQDFGVVHSNGTSTGGFLFLQNGTADILIGSYGLTEVRSKYFQTTTVYLENDVSWCAPLKPEISYYKTFKRAVNFILIACVGLLCLCMALLIWCMATLDARESPSYRSILLSFLRCFSVLLGISVRMLPRSEKARVIMGSLIITALVLNVFYSSRLTSLLVSTKHYIKYDRLLEIYEDNLTTYSSASMITHFRTYKPTYPFEVDVDEMLKNFVACDNKTKCLEEIPESDSVLYLPKFERDYLFKVKKVPGKSLIYCSEDYIRKFPLAIYLRRGFPLAETFNRIIERVLSSGLIRKWKNDAVGNEVGLNVGQPKQNIIKLGHLEPVFVLYLWANGLAILVFVGELIIGRGRQNIN